MKKNIVLCVCLIVTSILYCQTIAPTVNKTNLRGEKEGLWITYFKKDKLIANYKDGKYDGPIYRLQSNNNILYFGQFKNGKYDGIWYWFDKQGQCVSKITILNANNKIMIIQKDMNKKVSCEVEAYEIDYYCNMKIKAEGKILFNNGDSVEMGEFLNHGIWKYYDTNGNCIQTIDETGVWHHS